MKEGKQYSLEEALKMVGDEVERAKRKHQNEFHSLHEGYGVLLEEVDELWDEIKAKNPDKEKIREEAVQTAAMALRIITELT